MCMLEVRREWPATCPTCCHHYSYSCRCCYGPLLDPGRFVRAAFALRNGRRKFRSLYPDHSAAFGTLSRNVPKPDTTVTLTLTPQIDCANCLTSGSSRVGRRQGTHAHFLGTLQRERARDSAACPVRVCHPSSHLHIVIINRAKCCRDYVYATLEAFERLRYTIIDVSWLLLLLPKARPVRFRRVKVQAHHMIFELFSTYCELTMTWLKSTPRSIHISRLEQPPVVSVKPMERLHYSTMSKARATGYGASSATPLG